MRRNQGLPGRLLAIAWLGLFAVLVPGASADVVPKRLNFQGRLTDSSGNSITSAVSMTFKIFDAITGGTELWSETQVVSVSTGVYSVSLGSVTALSTSVFSSGSGTFLQVQAGADAAMTPRIAFSAVPYTFTAQNFLSALPMLDLLTVTPMNASVTNAATFTVPAGKILIFRSTDPGGCRSPLNNATHCQLSVTGSHTMTNFNGSGIAAAGDVLASTSALVTIRIMGGLVNANSGATLVLQNLAASGGTFTAPAGQNLYFQIAHAGDCTSGNVTIGGFVVDGHGGVLQSGQTLTNGQNCINSLNGWLK